MQVYDKEGRFQVEKFEQLFTKYDRTGKGGLSWDDVTEMVWHHQVNESGACAHCQTPRL